MELFSTPLELWSPGSRTGSTMASRRRVLSALSLRLEPLLRLMYNKHSKERGSTFQVSLLLFLKYIMAGDLQRWVAHL